MFTLLLNIESEEDRTFVEEIYIKYEKKMYQIAQNILQNHYDAEDCVHDTIRIIINSLDKFKSAYQNNCLDSLIMIACKNCALNIYHKNQKRTKEETSTVTYDPEINDYSEIDIPDDHAEIEKILQDEEKMKELQMKILLLDPTYRDVLTLKMMDFSYKEIANFLCISQDVARQRVHRARKKLIDMISGG